MKITLKNKILYYSNFVPFLLKEILLLPRLSRVDKVQLSVIEISNRFNQDKDNSLKILEILQSYDLNLANVSKDVLYEIFTALASKKKLAPLRLKNLHNDLKLIEMTCMTSKEWLILYEMFCFKGLFYLGYTCRKHSENIYFEESLKKENKSELDILSSPLVEKKSVTEKRFSALKNLISTQSSLTKNSIPEFDSDFYKLIYQKSIAVIGPSKSLNKDALEIDNFDVVVRLNYTSEKKGCDFHHKGMRVDISYFNGEQSNVLNSKNNLSVLDSIQYSCFKGDKVFDNIRKKCKNAKYRRIISFSDFAYHGTYNLIPLVLMDLLLYNPRNIKVFHSDLMLTQKRYNGYYSYNTLEKTNSEINNSFRVSSITHDPITQYNLLKRLYDIKKISGDKVFEKVMDIGLLNYLKNLQDLYYD